MIASAWSRDGRYVYYSADIFAANGKAQGMVLDMDGSKDHKAMAATPSQGNVFGGSFSPDDKWVAYLSDETGRFEVYVTTFPDHVGEMATFNRRG